MKKIYVMCPYTHDSASVRESRFVAVTNYSASLIRQGFCVYSPITHTHPMSLVSGLYVEWSFWRDFDIEFLKWADEGHVLMLDGWAKSAGVTDEIDILTVMKKDVKYIGEENAL